MLANESLELGHWFNGLVFSVASPALGVSSYQAVAPEPADQLDQEQRAAVAARLLGAHTVLTGIPLEIGCSLVDMQQDLSAIVTLGNLKAGIEFALRQAR